MVNQLRMLWILLQEQKRLTKRLTKEKLSDDERRNLHARQAVNERRIKEAEEIVNPFLQQLPKKLRKFATAHYIEQFNFADACDIALEYSNVTDTEGDAEDEKEQKNIVSQLRKQLKTNGDYWEKTF